MWTPILLCRDISVYFQQVYSSRQLIIIKRTEKRANVFHSDNITMSMVSTDFQLHAVK